MKRKKVIRAWVVRGSGAQFWEAELECGHIESWHTWKTPKTMTCNQCKKLTNESVKDVEAPPSGQGDKNEI